MNFRIELGSKAFQALSRGDKTNKSRVFKKLKSLNETPFSAGSKKIKGEENVLRSGGKAYD
jgi:hypothetical protein